MHAANRREAAIAGEVVVVVDLGTPGAAVSGVVVVVAADGAAPGTDVGGDDPLEAFGTAVALGAVPAYAAAGAFRTTKDAMAANTSVGEDARHRGTAKEASLLSPPPSTSGPPPHPPTPSCALELVCATGLGPPVEAPNEGRPSRR